jgi:hypothetical protein
VSTTGTDRQLKVMATDHALLAIRQWQMAEGRFLDEHDLRNRERVVVLSEALARAWQWKVGDIIQLRDTPFRVIGIVRVTAGALDGEPPTPR